MGRFSTSVGLDGLIDLAQRDGVDIRATLLRVLTDLYVQSPAHAPDDERQYTELALRLMDAVDIPARAVLAKRLATYPAAPREIIHRLARDVSEVAEPILKHCSSLTPADLDAIAKECGPGHAATIAKRGEPVAPAEGAPATADASVPAPAEASELCELFFAAGGPERRLTLLSLDYAPIVPAEPPSTLQRADIWRIESAALQHNTGVVVRELERALGVSHRQARRIVEDELGEPIVVAAKAMSLPADVLQRMLLFMNPRVGQSVDRVFELASLYGEISVEAARRLVALWRDADPTGRKSGAHEPLLWHDAAESARQALVEISRRTSGQRDTLSLQRSEGGTGTEGR